MRRLLVIFCILISVGFAAYFVYAVYVWTLPDTGLRFEACLERSPLCAQLELEQDVSRLRTYFAASQALIFAVLAFLLSQRGSRTRS